MSIDACPGACSALLHVGRGAPTLKTAAIAADGRPSSDCTRTHTNSSRLHDALATRHSSLAALARAPLGLAPSLAIPDPYPRCGLRRDKYGAPSSGKSPRWAARPPPGALREEKEGEELHSKP